MNKIPPEYRPLVYIAFVFMLLLIFYFTFSPLQICKRGYMADGYDRVYAARVCSHVTSW